MKVEQELVCPGPCENIVTSSDTATITCYQNSGLTCFAKHSRKATVWMNNLFIHVFRVSPYKQFTNTKLSSLQFLHITNISCHPSANIGDWRFILLLSLSRLTFNVFCCHWISWMVDMLWQIPTDPRQSKCMIIVWWIVTGELESHHLLVEISQPAAPASQQSLTKVEKEDLEIILVKLV